MITVTKATYEDIKEFSKNIRPMDAEEVKVVSGLPLSVQLMDIYEQDTKAIKRDGVLLGIGGYHHDFIDNKGTLSDGVIGWMLLTNEVENHKFEFLRWSKKYVDDLLKEVPFIMNTVYKKNKLHLSYLKFLGAKFTKNPIDDNMLVFIIERG